MTHINGDRGIGTNADMGTPPAPLTPTEIVRGGMHRSRRARPETPEQTDESTQNEDAGTDG